MIRFLPLPLILVGHPALAHVGHLGDMAGHDHWVAGAAIGAALAISLWGALKGKTDKPDEADADTTDEEEEAA